MKLNNCILSVALILGSCLAAVPADVRANEKAEQVKEAKAEYSKFRNVMKCVRNWKGCTRKERKEAAIYGLGTLAAIAALGTGIGYGLWRRGKRAAAARPVVPETVRSTGDPAAAAAAVPSAPMAALFDPRSQQSFQLTIYSDVLGELTRMIGEFRIDDPGLKNAVQDIETAISGARQKLIKKEDVGAAVLSIAIQIRDAQLLFHQKRQAQRDVGAPLTEWEKELMVAQQRVEQEAERMIAAQQAGQDPLGLRLLEEEEEEEEQPQ